jgi:TfoX/Sxy family transcriptional regulator of competence genes
MTANKARKWKPAPAELITRFEASVSLFPGIRQRRMFGYPAAFVNGHLFAGLFENRMVLKLPAESRSKLLEIPGAARFEPIPGRPMGEFVVVPPSLVRNRTRLRPWLESAYAYVKSFRPKVKKTRPRSHTR